MKGQTDFYNHSIIIRNGDIENETLNPFKVELNSIPFLYLNTLIFNKDQYVSGATGNRRHGSAGSVCVHVCARCGCDV